MPGSSPRRRGFGLAGGTSPGMRSSWSNCSLKQQRIQRSRERVPPYAPISHFFMKLFLAAPASGLPSEPTALGAHASALHFFMNDVFAAPASALPSLPTALLSQVSSARAEPAAKVARIAARKIRFIMCLPEPEWRADWRLESWRNQAGSAGLVDFATGAVSGTTADASDEHRDLNRDQAPHVLAVPGRFAQPPHGKDQTSRQHLGCVRNPRR